MNPQIVWEAMEQVADLPPLVSLEAPHSRPGASLPLCAGFASGTATPTPQGTLASGRDTPVRVCSMREASTTFPHFEPIRRP